MDARAEQRLVGVDVADARDLALVEQQRLDRRRAPARERAQVLGREPLVERLEPEARGEERLQRLRAEQQLARAEAARVDDHQAARLRAARRAAPTPMRTRGVRRLGRPGCTAAAPVIRRCWARWTSPSKLHSRYLPRLPRSLDAPALQRAASSRGRQRARPAGVEDLDLLEPPALHQRRELAADRLDLGKLGHVRRSAYEGLPRQLLGVAAGQPAQHRGADIGQRAVVASPANARRRPRWRAPAIIFR